MLVGLLPQMPQLLKLGMHQTTSNSGANVDPVSQCDAKFRLVNKQFTDSCIILHDLSRNIILGLNWRCNYRICYNWNANG